MASNLQIFIVLIISWVACGMAGWTLREYSIKQKTAKQLKEYGIEVDEENHTVDIHNVPSVKHVYHYDEIA